MSLRKFGIGAGVAAMVTAWAGTALALPQNWGLTFQTANSPVMERIESFHTLLLYIITAISLFVLALLVWIVVRYNQRANPVPSKTHHNTLLEVVWTVIPVIILVIIAVPSFRLLYFEAGIPKPDVIIKAIGKQWYWTYEYPAAKFQFDSLGLSDDKAKAAGEPRLLGVDNPIVLPVGKVIEVDTAGADVIHSWALPEMGVKMDAVPGRINHTWFKAERVGTYYGECSELCGARHAFMPIEVKIVPEAEYEAWLAAGKKKFSAIADSDETPARLASK
ncbi:MAG TPA: cytochrome c oxidase subunit II [Rhizomicrobium sp.]|nr:cytochrome c oxidase subunit II [Rhizomicrobium sp.]